MNRVCVGAVRVEDIIIYRADLVSSNLKTFIKSGKEYVECVQTKRNNIYYDGTIILQEWDKYKVKALDGSLTPEDFIKSGEFGDEEFGTLLFKNCVGITKFKGIIINIESSKISSDEMDRLMRLVNTYIINLSFDFNQPTFSSIKRERKKQTDLDYHIYLLVNNALSSEDNNINIFRNFSLIENNPCRTMHSEVHYDDLSTARELSDEAILDIFSGSSNLKRYYGRNNKLARKIEVEGQQYLPQEILFEEIIDSFDNPENRFIKYFINWCLGIVERFNEVFVAQEDFKNTELIASNNYHIKKLKQLLRQTFLKNVGEIQTIPMYSTVLTRRDGYRQMYSLFLGLKSMPEVENESENVKELLENKSLDVLYENYCYFGMSEMIADIYGQRLDKKKYCVQKSSFSKTLEKKTDSNYFEFERTDDLPKVRVHYNKNYVVESYSKAFAPDISLEIFNSNDKLSAMYVFDSKFRATISEKTADDEVYEKRKYKYDDISKMHTYRDALKVAHGAFILYPGTEDVIFYLDEEPMHRELLYGVGAFKLGPGRKADFTNIRYYVEKLLKLYRKKEDENKFF